MQEIIKEKISADHLLYASLKYTKTTEVMLNLIKRWRSMLEIASDKILDELKKQKKLKIIPSAPKLKIDFLKDYYKKNAVLLESLELLEFFKRLENLEKTREGEFRKNVNLKVTDRGNIVTIDTDKLKEYSFLLEKFISELKQILK